MQDSRAIQANSRGSAHGIPLSRRRALLGALAGLAPAGVWAAGAAAASGFPSHPLKLVVAAPAGGPPDALARLLAEVLGIALGQPVIVENKPGGIGMVAATYVARQPPDGHTLMLSWIGNATSQSLIARPPVDINRDFEHITQVSAMANVLVAAPSAPCRTLAELLEHAHKRPRALTYASSGNGSSGHLAMEMLKQRAGVALVHVPYRGAVPGLLDLMADEVDLMFINQDAVLPYLPSRRFTVLAVSGAQRHPLLRMTPTVAESGFPGFEATTWAGLSAPAGTPAAVVSMLHGATLQAINGPVGAMYETLGAQVVGSTPAEYRAFVLNETRKWGAVIRSIGIQPG